MTSMSESLYRLEMTIGNLVVLDEIGRSVRCLGCSQNAMIGEVIVHPEDCAVEAVMAAFREHYKAAASARLIVPEAMPAQGIYSNMLTLLALNHVLMSVKVPFDDIEKLLTTINGTMVGLVKQLKRHVKGKSVIDQVLALLPGESASDSAEE